MWFYPSKFLSDYNRIVEQYKEVPCCLFITSYAYAGYRKHCMTDEKHKNCHNHLNSKFILTLTWTLQFIYLRLWWIEIHADTVLCTHDPRIAQWVPLVHVAKQLLHAADVQHQVPLRPLWRPDI